MTAAAAATQPFRLIMSAAPRHHLFTNCAKRPNITRALSTTRTFKQDNKPPSNPFSAFGMGGPAPPPLPKEEQEIFEALQRQSTGAFSTPRSPPRINQSPDSTVSERAEAETKITDRTDNMAAGEGQEKSKFKEDFDKVIEARGKGEELHPNVRRGATPEFEGDVNPKTGEVGGPKNEPLRWGAAGEWSYNGRTTDF